MILEEARRVATELMVPERSIKIDSTSSHKNRTSDDEGWFVQVEIQGRYLVDDVLDIIDMRDVHDVHFTPSVVGGYKTTISLK